MFSATTLVSLVVGLPTIYVCSFSTSSSLGMRTPVSINLQALNSQLFLSSSSEITSDSITKTPVFDFTGNKSEIDKVKSVSSFERIDDAIMGGISLSALKDVENESYASWSGVCRTDGGGFCGMRTLPFKEPLAMAKENDGLYVKCRLASDNEPDRRIWKMTIRTDTSRGELVYQNEFQIPKQKSEDETAMEWVQVCVPFDSFKEVRGPRMVADGRKLDLSGGIYQIGITLSKFQMGLNTTTLQNFRPGYFDLQLQEIGFYKEKEKEEELVAVKTPLLPDTLSKVEANKNRPLPLKLLLPIAKLFFSEKANRRRSAMKILREKRNMSRTKAILFGIQSRKKSMGMIRSMGKTFGILGVDAARTVVLNIFKIVLGYPLKLVSMFIRTVKKMLGMKVKIPLK